MKFLIFFLISILSINPTWCTYNADVGQSFSLTLAIDVVNEVKATPYIITPDGLVTTQPSVTLNSVTNTFSAFTLTDPLIGIYTSGVFLLNTGLLPATVSLNTTLSNLVFNYAIPVTVYLRPTVNNYSITIDPGERTALSINFQYVAATVFAP